MTRFSNILLKFADEKGKQELIKTMKKKNLFVVLLAVIAMTGQSKNYKTIKNPVAMSHNIYGGDFKAREIIFRDTATIVHFTIEYPKGKNFRFASLSYLMDEDGNRYPLRSAEGLKLDTWIQSPESGITEFTMNFEPLPKRTQVFDFIEGDDPRAFILLGIRDKKTKLKVPTVKELSEATPWTVPADWFKTDTITVKGRIEGYNAEQFGFTSMECYFKDVFEKDDGTLVLEIANDGTFCKKFLASYPIRQDFFTRQSKVDFREIPFYARPGETIDITVKKNERGEYVCVYGDGSSHDAERWLRTGNMIVEQFWPIIYFEGTLDEGNIQADKMWQNAMYLLQNLSRREHYTPMEIHLALADVQAQFADYYLSYVRNRKYSLMKSEQFDGEYHTEILDSAEWQKLFDINTYHHLRRIDFDNPLLFASKRYRLMLNDVQYADPIWKRKFEGGVMNEDGTASYVDTYQQHSAILVNNLAALRDLTGTDHDNLTVQLCAYKDALSDFNLWREKEEAIPLILADTTMTMEMRMHKVELLPSLSKMFPLYLNTFSEPYFRQKAEQFYAYKMAQTDLSSPLPDTAIANLIRSLSVKYPGRFLLIDFWGMGCGPCRSAIERSKQKRAEIAGRDDIKLIFIAGERTTEGSDAYKKYVAEWLANEETVCVTNADFSRLQEMFRFDGIPHYETITPDCRRVCDVLSIDGLHNIENELQRLKEKIK